MVFEPEPAPALRVMALEPAMATAWVVEMVASEPATLQVEPMASAPAPARVEMAALAPEVETMALALEKPRA